MRHGADFLSERCGVRLVDGKEDEQWEAAAHRDLHHGARQLVGARALAARPRLASEREELRRTAESFAN